MIEDVTLNSRSLPRLSPEVESYYRLNGFLHEGDNELILRLKRIETEHKHVCVRTMAVNRIF